SRINAERLKIRLNFGCRTGHAFFVRSPLPTLDLSGVMSKKSKTIQTRRSVPYSSNDEGH
ncbi:MAG: hypothetical protein MR972_07895, partial [Oscillibacter sp.]|nr:hypothetical protein [Oscillibacter sp.]